MTQKRLITYTFNECSSICSQVGGKVKSVGGNPGEVVCKVAATDKASLIVIGSRGMSTIRRTLLGSVSDYVMHHAHVPVLICKPAQNKN